MIKRIKHYLVKWKGYDHTQFVATEKRFELQSLIVQMREFKTKEKNKIIGFQIRITICLFCSVY